MKYYEILYIVNPNFEQPRIDEIKKEVAGEVTKLMSAEIINHRIFGKKRLAYQIEKHKYGTYMLLHLDAKDSTKLIEVNSFFGLNKSIIRHLVVRLDQRPEEDLTPEASNLNIGTAREQRSAPATEPEVPVEEVKEVAEDETPVEEVAVEGVDEAAAEAPVEEAVVEDVADKVTDAPVEETVVEKVTDKVTEAPVEETVVEKVAEEVTDVPVEETVVEKVAEEAAEEPAAEAEPAEKETEDKS